MTSAAVTEKTMTDTSHLGANPGGKFSLDEHTFMPDIWGWVCIEFDIVSILDVGCGIGSNLSWFHEFGFEVL